MVSFKAPGMVEYSVWIISLIVGTFIMHFLLDVFIELWCPCPFNIIFLSNNSLGHLLFGCILACFTGCEIIICPFLIFTRLVPKPSDIKSDLSWQIIFDISIPYQKKR